MIRALKRIPLSAANTAACSKLLDVLERADRQRENLLAVLTYHRVNHCDATPSLWPGMISATPDAFARQMAFLADNCHVVSMSEVLEARGSGQSLPPRAVMVTFDDAYRDFADHAWPILRMYGIPVTLFVPTAYPNQPELEFWWDRLYRALNTNPRDDISTPLGRLRLKTDSQRQLAFRRIKEYVKSVPHSVGIRLVDQLSQYGSVSRAERHVLSWNELRELAKQGVTLGAHTRTHPLVNRIPLNRARTEAVESMRDLQRETGSALPIFAYPSGAWNENVVDELRREGFGLAFTTARGLNDMDHADPLRLRRINIGIRTTERMIRAQLLVLWLYHRRRRESSTVNGMQPIKREMAGRFG